jgi:Mlc titration factor MtfA (ptsG expression regulator)
MFGWKKRRRRRIRAQPFPRRWLDVLRRNVGFYHTLTAAEQAEIQGMIQVFVAEKNWEAHGGLEMTDEIRVTVAAQACLLLLRLDADFYPRLRSILVYPSSYLPERVETLQHGQLEAPPAVHLGESWSSGVVVLAWDSVRAGAADAHDGRNVVFHEFAHQLDQEEGASDGVPLLERASAYRTWARVLEGELGRLRQDAEQGRETVLDVYGATNRAEFFAVATEAFFERPRELRELHPALYEELRGFFGQDSAERPLPE